MLVMMTVLTWDGAVASEVVATPPRCAAEEWDLPVQFGAGPESGAEVKRCLGMLREVMAVNGSMSSFSHGSIWSLHSCAGLWEPEQPRLRDWWYRQTRHCNVSQLHSGEIVPRLGEVSQPLGSSKSCYFVQIGGANPCLG